MSTSSTNSSVIGTKDRYVVENDVRTNRSDSEGRKRGQSAPAMFRLTRNASPLVMPTDAEVEALLNELKSSAADGHRVKPEVEKTTSTSHATIGPMLDEAAHDRLIDELFQSQLSEARKIDHPKTRAKKIQAALDMLKHMAEPGRTKARMQILSAISEGPVAKQSEPLLTTLIDDFIAAHSETSQEQTSKAAQSLVECLSEAIAHYPIKTKCKLLVAQLWAAKNLNNFTMAKAAIDHFADYLPQPSPQLTCKKIERAVAYIDKTPPRFSLMVAMTLYQSVPDEAPWALKSLEAIAAQNLLLPHTREVQSFCATLNQRIYELRLAAAD